jgi:hypothetical protein
MGLIGGRSKNKQNNLGDEILGHCTDVGGEAQVHLRDALVGPFLIGRLKRGETAEELKGQDTQSPNVHSLCLVFLFKKKNT